MLKEPESASPRLPLAITAVVDSRRSVANSGTTVDNDLKVSGTGTESAVVALFDGGVDTNKTTSVNAFGNWDIPVTAVLGPHSYTAREEPGADSPPWLITVVTEVKPVITSIKDAAGNVIPNGGSIEDNTTVIIYGTASVGQIVELFDFNQSAVLIDVDSSGNWRFQAWGLQYKQYSVTAKALYGGDQVSDPWVFTVDAAELNLPKPVVTQAPGDILNPIDALNGATVVVTYDMQTTDTIGLSWNGLDNLVPPQQGSTLGSVTFTIPPSAVAAVIGKTIPVMYAVVRNGDPKPSARLDLTVQTLSDSVLEAPRILQASGDGSLDVGALTGDADLRVKPWPFIAVGQLISLRFEGTKADGSAYNWLHPTWQNFPIGSTVEPSTTVALNNLKELKNGSSLTLIFDVSFDGGITKVLFPVRVLNIIQAAASGFEDFEAAAPGTLPSGTSLVLRSGLKLEVYLNSPADPSVAIVRAGSPQGEHGFQYLSIGVNTIGFNQTFLTLPGAIFTTVEFTLWAVNNVSGQRLQVVVYFDAGPAKEMVYAAPVGSRLPVKYTAPPGTHITSLRLANAAGGPGSIAFDSMRWSA